MIYYCLPYPDSVKRGVLRGLLTQPKITMHKYKYLKTAALRRE